MSLQHLDCFRLRFTHSLECGGESVLNPFIYLAFIALSIGHHGLEVTPARTPPVGTGTLKGGQDIGLQQHFNTGRSPASVFAGTHPGLGSGFWTEPGTRSAQTHANLTQIA